LNSSSHELKNDPENKEEAEKWLNGPNRSGQKITNAYNLTYVNVKMHVRKVNEKWNRIPESRKKA